MSNALVGQSIDVDLGMFVPRLSFVSDNEMRLQAKIGPTEIDEVVPVAVAKLRPDVFVVAWTESSGNFVVQVHDRAAGTVVNHARLADGQLFQVEGTVRAAV